MKTLSLLPSCKVCLFLVLWVGFAASIGYADCSPEDGYGTDGHCLTGDGCATICGTTSSWCVTWSCTQTIKCLGILPYTAIQCVTLGCKNPAQTCANDC